MILVIINGLKSRKLFLPDDISGNYYLYDDDNEVLATIFEKNATWNVLVNKGRKLIVNNTECATAILENNCFFSIRDEEGKIYYIYGYPTYINTKYIVTFNKNDITIGSGKQQAISYGTNLLNQEHAVLSYRNNIWIIEAKDKHCYINDIQIKKKILLHGDIIFLHGLKIIPIGDKLIIFNTQPKIPLNLDGTIFSAKQVSATLVDNVYDIDTEKKLFLPSENFARAPRFNTAVEPKEFKIAPPPSDKDPKQQPAILTVGPQLTMMLTSSVMLFSTLNNIASGQSTLASSLPSIITSVVTMVSSLFWPAVTRRYQRREAAKNKIKAIKQYEKYLSKKDKQIGEEISKEIQVAVENNTSLEECQSIIYNKKRNLWERTRNHDDFLTVRLGIGNVDPQTKISYEEKEFGIDENTLVEKVRDLVAKYSVMENVPLNLSLADNRFSAVIGATMLTQSFINSVLLQLFTFHSYTELKVVIFTNDKKSSNWNFLRGSVHCWDDQKTIRFFGCGIDEIKYISSYLDGIFNSRVEKLKEDNNAKASENERDTTFQEFVPYYLIIIDDLALCRNIEVIKHILDSDRNYGFSILFKNDRISNLPSQVTTFMNIDEKVSGLFGNQLSMSNQKQFAAEFNNRIDMYGCIEKLANIPIEVEKGKFELPKSISFLDMYNVGKIEQLNSLERWKNSPIVTSLSVPVGIDQNGDLFMMDAHEKAYGPHGLVAGTTGSGKSEWIITYILSLAVNFHPDEVQFVLIDYKGGGLAGSFENSELGIRLPHLVGTITNLDKSEIRRSIASIEAELKRRQRMFNEAREKLKDSSMNICKYQDFYRKGLLSEPLSHLFIISDEFAELKSQQPEFLEQLISTARIGRSLGVHLILATQKPSGVVTDQIWSNSRFKVALRVQDTADSKDMIQTPDAAYLKNTGAFYLQVGNNEFYGLGQSAYAGFKYVPSEVVKKNIDTDIHLINNVGSEVHTTTFMTNEQLNNSQGQQNLGEQLLNIIKYVDELAKKKNINPRRLWLNKIPNIIFIDNIKKKYNFVKQNYFVEPVIGEYDNPYTQSQNIFTLPISSKGNIVLYGKGGSGKELLLQSLVYSLSTTYSLQEINVYIIDCGAETLKIFDQNPIVGNYTTAAEVDKIDGIFKYVLNAMKTRKDLFNEYGGNYDQYIKLSKKGLPRILVIINNFQSFMETFDGLMDTLMYILRECTKYGISFIVSNTNKLPYKMLETINYTIALNCEKDDDYREYLNTKITPADGKCRGITEIDGSIFEFQGAIPVMEEKMNETVKNLNKVLFNAYKLRVPSVPYIPEFVTFESIKALLTNMEKFPLGIRKLTIKTEFVNFKREMCFAYMSKNADMLEDTTRNICRMINAINSNDMIYFFDPDGVYDEYFINKNISYISEDIPTVLQNLYVFTEDEMKKFNPKDDPYAKDHIYIFIRKLTKFVEQIDSETSDYFAKAINNNLQLKNITFILIDTFNNFREIGGEMWLNPLKQNINGLWIGNGVNEQSIMDVIKFDIRPSNQGIPDDLGYAIDSGVARQIKVIEDIKEEEDEI